MKKIFLLISLLIVIILLTGCNKEEQKECIKSHNESKIISQPMCVFNGKMMSCYSILNTINVEVCDEYKENTNGKD